MTKTSPDSLDRQLIDRLETADGELAGLHRELEHYQRLATLGTMTAGVAHEINNLLTPALGYAQLLESGTTADPRLHRAATRCRQAIVSASHVLEATLDLSAAGREDASADVAATVQKAIDCLGRSLIRGGVTVDVVIEPETAVAMAPHALQQVVLNLVLNATRALAGRADGEIRIAAGRREGGRVHLSVADNGPGIPPEIADRLFEAFITAPASGAPSGDHGGLGLGLAMCRRVIEEIAGTISVKSEPGKGASFEIDVPIAEECPQKAA